MDSCIFPSNYSFTNISQGASSYIWTFDTIANSIQSDPFLLLIAMVFTKSKLLAINSSGCSDSSIDFINVSPIPNADLI